MRLHSGLDHEPDVPAMVVVERRHQPDRRTVWRGGRRDSDWLKRPMGAWQRLAAPGGNVAPGFWVRLFRRPSSTP